MVNRQALLADLQKLLARLEADLLERSESDDVPEVGAKLRAEYQRARGAERTAQNYEDWRSDAITQAAAAWVLSCVFVRFLEDNAIIDPPKIAGPNERLQLARDEHELYFREHPRETDREYLLTVVDDLAKLPGTKDVFGEHNPIHELSNWLSGDAAGELLGFFQRIDANTGVLVHDFTDANWDTRFLGDLYQDLSEAARKKYALLQTPEFVEEFILDRTLNPALDEFGLDAGPVLDRDGKPLTEVGFRMIDPACGSGHFMLGAFPRILDRWQRKEPASNVRELVQRTLDSIHGVDVNPYAVAIARFRLLLAAMRACGIRRLADAPAFRLNLACGDSLLHSPLKTGHQVFDFELTNGDAECEHAYQSEDLPLLRLILSSGHYHAVVANPPYIQPKDRLLNQRYRKRFKSCHRQYSLAVPFLERIFRLAVPQGYTGQITANSFMKREFGKKLIESFLPTVDLTHVIDTSGAHIPGHGTPTVILFGRNRPPVASTLRTVLGIKGKPATPEVWLAIVDQVDRPGSQSEYVSAGDSLRDLFNKHPWSIGGGGAAELKERLDESAETVLARCVTSIGFFQDTHADEAFVLPGGFPRRHGVSEGFKPQVRGDDVRDWGYESFEEILFPYHDDLTQWSEIPQTPQWSWLHALRTSLWSRSTFGGGNYRSAGRPWFDFHQFPKDRARIPMSIAFAFVATHNHFMLDRGGKVFNRSSPVIKLSADSSEEDHLALVGPLNSSTGCFWMKQVFHDKGSTVDSQGARQTTAAFENFREFTGTGLLKFPLPDERPSGFARQLDRLAQQLKENLPKAAIDRWESQLGPELAKENSLQQCLDDAFTVTILIRGEMLLVQEDLDWECYRLYGLIEEDLTVRLAPDDEDRSIPPANRAFEIFLARKIAAGEAQSTWFERHGMTPNLELPDPAYNERYREIVARRIAVIESNPEIALIEQPEYKRRWNWEPWESQKERALREWLLSRLESYFDFDGRMNDRGEREAEADISLISVARLADIADLDPEFHQVGAALQGDLAFDIPRLVDELVRADSVPLLPVLRYKPSGLRKRSEWEQTWELQRGEDAGEDEGDIPAPPDYRSADFISTGGARYWSLRGKFDVPKERWVSFPHCEGPDGTLVIAWAGYDHLQLARAISEYFVRVQTELGGSDDPRLVPLLAGVIELLPWLKQWHNEPDAAFNGLRMGDYFESFITEEARSLNKTIEEIKAWTPPARTTGRRRRSAT